MMRMKEEDEDEEESGYYLEVLAEGGEAGVLVAHGLAVL
jgi:hypothetical protein